MFIDKLKRKAGTKKREQVIILTRRPEAFNELIEILSLYTLDCSAVYHSISEITAIADTGIKGQIFFIVDASAYSENDTVEISMTTRGRFQSMLIGEDDSIQAACIAKESGFASYFTLASEVRFIAVQIVSYFGHTRSRTSLVVGVCNTSADVEISYRVFHDLHDSRMMGSYSTLFVNCDIANVYFDAVLGVKANKQALESIMNIENEIDTRLALKLVSKIDSNFDYISFNAISEDHRANNIDAIFAGLERYIDAVANNYGFIFINIPYYALTLSNGIQLLNSSDVRLLLTDGKIESIYNIHVLKERIGFKQTKSDKKRDKLFSIRRQNETNKFTITDAEINAKLGVKVDGSTLLGNKSGFLSRFRNNDNSDNIIQQVLR